MTTTEQVQMQRQIPVLSTLLIAVNLAVFLAVTIDRGLLDVLAGLAGSLALVATAVVTGFDEASVGASAAFLGLMGALAVCPRQAWGAKLPVDKVVVAVMVVQLAPVVGIGSWVSSVAHLVGIAVGGAYGYRVRTTMRWQPPTSTGEGALSLVASGS